jgi:excisionase family DNA binding protein
MTRDLITYTEAAERLSVSRRTLFRMLADRMIEPVLVPRPSRRGTVPRLRAADIDRLRRAS